MLLERRQLFLFMYSYPGNEQIGAIWEDTTHLSMAINGLTDWKHLNQSALYVKDVTDWRPDEQKGWQFSPSTQYYRKQLNWVVICSPQTYLEEQSA